MLRAPSALHKYLAFDKRFHSSALLRNTLTPVSTISHAFHNVDIEQFRREAFSPELPLLMTGNESSFTPAITKWFSRSPAKEGQSRGLVLTPYLSQFGETVLPYELIVEAKGNNQPSPIQDGNSKIQDALAALTDGLPSGTFHRFYAPLSLFLEASHERLSYQLYIAQAQIADLPKNLQDDLPIPGLVRDAGNGDVYDSNLWMGIPPTYTPLHKDPNPNLFVQLASNKRVRIFRPTAGAAIFQDVQRRIGQSASAAFRGDEMMQGPERHALHEAVWGSSVVEGFEAVVKPGDALFIPKNWWHSIKSVGEEITASVNWWFR